MHLLPNLEVSSLHLSRVSLWSLPIIPVIPCTPLLLYSMREHTLPSYSGLLKVSFFHLVGIFHGILLVFLNTTYDLAPPSALMKTHFLPTIFSLAHIKNRLTSRPLLSQLLFFFSSLLFVGGGDVSSPLCTSTYIQLSFSRLH